MDTKNMCNVNHLDPDALLPPRKRLLAGLKRQNFDMNSPVPLPSTPGSENDYFNLYRSRFNIPNISDEGIIEASRIAALVAARAAEAARVNAEEKATKAVKAVAAAKAALELVATLSTEAADTDEFLKKSKMKKRVPVEALYNNKNNTKCNADEELVHKLHQAMNSSPRMSKNSSSSNLKSHKHKKLKHSAFSQRTSICSGVSHLDGGLSSTTSSYGNAIIPEVNDEGPVQKKDTTTIDLNKLKWDKGEEQEPSRMHLLKLEKSKVDTILSKDKFAETLGSSGKKRWKLKQKKLPLSVCSFKDRSIPKDELKPHGMQLLEDHGAQAGLVFRGAFR